ncbi:MAG: choice-of-anchor D domain-containing protein [Bacteroidales bacterium]
MEKRITNLILLLLSVVTVLLFNTKVAYCQNDEPVSVDGEHYFSVYGEVIRETPEFFTLLRAFDKNEMHVLDTLSNEERAFIESEVNPPAIGVVRDLKQPVVFNLRNVEIPLIGEISTSGGRLSRINDELLVFSTYFKSEKADEIRIFFSEGNFPHGVKVNLFSKDDFAFNQIELSSELDEYGFYTRSIFADYVIIQVVIPSECFEEDLYFSITKIIHVDNIYIPEEYTRSCYQDANCSYANSYTHIDNLRRAVAQLTFPVGGGYYICSGGQLNDLRTKDFQPFLLTANHCFNTQTSAAGLQAKFYYWSTSCNSGITNPNYILVNGANLIATNYQTDFTLVLLKAQGGDYYMGWTRDPVPHNATLHSVHHPGGMLQQYSRHTNTTSPIYYCQGFNISDFHYTVTLGGQTSGGSSGGIIANEAGRVVGQLFGVCHPEIWDECNYSSYNNMWGRFNVSYDNNNLQFWLNNGGASVNMSTDPTTNLAFGSRDVGSSTYLTVTVTNTGSIPNYLNLEAGPISIIGLNANQFSFVGKTSLYLPPGTSGTFTIRFKPTSTGLKTATLYIPHNADNMSSPKTISLTGTGVVPGNICKECPEYDFIITPSVSWQTHSSSHVMNGCKMYRFSVNNGYKYTFKTGCGNGASANYDTQLYLFNNSCIQIESDDNSCENNTSKIEWTSNYTGYAYLKVKGASSNYGNYTLAYNYCVEPSQPGSISGPTNVCQGTIYNYSILSVSGATSYEWQLPSGWSGSSNSTSISATSGASGGDIRVRACNSCGCSSWRTLNVNVTTIPAKPGSISGLSSVPAGTTKNYSILPVSGATSYTWTYSGIGSISGSGTSVNLTAYRSGILSVTANNECGASTARTKAITTIGVATNFPIHNIIISNGMFQCFDATQTITVAGNNTQFIVQSGGDAELIAGNNIIMLTGTRVMNGGKLLARITTTNDYCTQDKSLISSDDNDGLFEKSLIENKDFFRIYPNPTTGYFILELLNDVAGQNTIVEVYTMLGSKILIEGLSSDKLYQFDLTQCNPGIYLIKVIQGNNYGVEKLIRQ